MSSNTSNRCAVNHSKGIAACFVAAFFLIGACAVFYYLNADSGIHINDESKCIALAHRFINGDRPIAEEWSAAMMLSFLLVVPFKLFTMATGSTEGIVLFSRYLFITVHTAFSFSLFAAFRKYRWAAVIASFLYMCCIPQEMYSLNYNSISLMAIGMIGILLFTGNEPGKGKLIISGVFFAIAVIALPPLAVIYPIYSFYVLFLWRFHTQKRLSAPTGQLYEQPSGWLFLSAGIASFALIFFLYFFTTISVTEIIVSVPAILAQIRTSFHSSLSMVRFERITNAIGLPLIAATSILFLFIAINRNNGARQRIVCFVFVAADAVIIDISIWLTYFGVRGGRFGDVFPILARGCPLTIVGIAAYLLTREKNRRFLPFYVLFMVYDCIRTLSSNVVFGLGTFGANVASVMMIRDFLAETRQVDRRGSLPEKGKKNLKRILVYLCILPVAAALCGEAIWKTQESGYRILENYYIETTSALTAEIGRGPLKGIKTTYRLRSVVDNIMTDLDNARENGKEKIYIAGSPTWGYLYLDDTYTTCSVMFEEKTITASQSYYWELHPGKKPECIYIPFFDTGEYKSIRTSANRIKDTISSFCTYRLSEGKAGYILSDIVWKE